MLNMTATARTEIILNTVMRISSPVNQLRSGLPVFSVN